MTEESIADRADLDVIRESLQATLVEPAPRTMPPAYYTSPDMLRLEQEYLFPNEWACLGHAGEVPDIGDYFATEIAGEPLLVVRDTNSEIAVFSNVCRHRGTPLAEGSGRKKRFACPYRAWTYGLDGSLLAAPFMEGVSGFDKKACSLPKFRHEIWNGFIYVNLSGDAAPLAE